MDAGMECSDNPAQVTRLLQAYAAGESESLNAVVALVYQELQRLAHAHLRRSAEHAHMETTVLVHEAYAKLAQGATQQFADRQHFFAVASRAMRQLVVDSYRARSAAKRGGDVRWVTVTAMHLPDLDDPQRLLAAHQALERLAAEDEELVNLIDMACFGGLSNDEIAELTDQTLRSVQRKMKRAQAWLGLYMSNED